MKRAIVLMILTAVGCGEPGGKLNSDPNAVPNNTPNNTSNNTSNNTPTNNTPNNGPGPITPSDYNQDCTIETDCALILTGDPCGCGPCFDAAINQEDIPAYQNDKSAAMCEEIACPAIACADEQVPHCNQETMKCEVRVTEYVQADEYDRSCVEPTDCVAVFEGEICEECQCPNAAINVNDAEAYNENFDTVCLHGSDCSCAAPEIDCIEGRCEVVL